MCIFKFMYGNTCMKCARRSVHSCTVQRTILGAISPYMPSTLLAEARSLTRRCQADQQAVWRATGSHVALPPPVLDYQTTPAQLAIYMCPGSQTQGLVMAQQAFSNSPAPLEHFHSNKAWRFIPRQAWIYQVMLQGLAEIEERKGRWVSKCCYLGFRVKYLDSSIGKCHKSHKCLYPLKSVEKLLHISLTQTVLII